jgi:paraquat-inducible protein B
MRGGAEGGKPVRQFTGLEAPPAAPDSAGGLRIELHADSLLSVQVGSPVFYLQDHVGKVEALELAKDGDGVVLHLYFPEENAALVRESSRFWNAGGFEISASLGKVEVESRSLWAMLSGGVAFDSPGFAKSAAAKDGARYWLHSNRDDIEDSRLRFGGLRVVVEAPHLGGVQVGDPVSYREMTVGAVISQELTPDSRRLRLHLNIENRYAPLVRSNTVFWNASGISADLGLTGLHIHAESLQALLSGGIAFATPDSSGHRVKAGSVFKLHPEVKDKWLKWDPHLSRGPAKAAPAGDQQTEASSDAKTDAEKDKKEEKKSPGLIARFFHHEGKSEEDAAKDAEPQKDASQQAAHHEKRHGFLSRRHR